MSEKVQRAIIAETGAIMAATIPPGSVDARLLPEIAAGIYAALSGRAPAEIAIPVVAEPSAPSIAVDPVEQVETETAVEEPVERQTIPLTQDDIAGSIGDKELRCLECGRGVQMLRVHLRNMHTLTPEEYREKWGLPNDYPMVSEAYLRGARSRIEGRGAIMAKARNAKRGATVRR